MVFYFLNKNDKIILESYFYGVVMVIILKGDITKSNTDAIVNAANIHLLAGSGVCGAIFRAANSPLLQEECLKYAPIKTGDAIITHGYNLKSKYIIHTAGPIYSSPEDAKYLRNSYYNSLKLADEYKLKSIAFPSISTGIYGYPMKDAAKVALDAIEEFSNDYPNSSIKEIYFYLFDDITYNIYLNEMDNR